MGDGQGDLLEGSRQIGRIAKRSFEGEYGWLTLKQTERHSYEKCQYDAFLERVAKMDELRAAKGGKRSN